VRTALGLVRGRVAYLLLALSVGWVLLRRRAAAPTLPALPPAPADPGSPVAPGGPADAAVWTVPGDVLATDAGLTAEPAAPAPEPPEVAASEAPTMEIPAVRPTSEAGDNLRAIRGIGPSMERMLQGLGITTYRQLAALDGDQLSRVRHALQDFRSRVEREDWTGQARELHRAKYGEAL